MGVRTLTALHNFQAAQGKTLSMEVDYGRDGLAVGSIAASGLSFARVKQFLVAGGQRRSGFGGG